MTIQRYNAETKTLEMPRTYKIRKILENGCIQKIDADTYACHPIAGYNSTTYRLSRLSEGGFNCTCQGYNKRGKCSHADALAIHLSYAQQFPRELF